MDQIDVVADVRCRTGEGPLWHPAEACLYWMDIPNGHLFRYDPRTSAAERVLDGPMLGAGTAQCDGSVLLFGWQGGIWRFCGNALAHVTTVAEVNGTRFNDALADSSGRVLAGTIPTRAMTSRLIAVAPNGDARVVVDGLGQSNGMALSADERTLYHVDTIQHVVRAFAYDTESGSPHSPRVIARFAEPEGAPDGMAIDEEGCLWIALWGGGCVIRIDASGRRLDRLAVPTPLTSSVAFGGPDLQELYVTSAGGDDRDRHGALAGSLFKLLPNVRGVIPAASAICIG